jgi:hypothetical protein
MNGKGRSIEIPPLTQLRSQTAADSMEESLCLFNATQQLRESTTALPLLSQRESKTGVTRIITSPHPLQRHERRLISSTVKGTASVIHAEPESEILKVSCGICRIQCVESRLPQRMIVTFSEYPNRQPTSSALRKYSVKPQQQLEGQPRKIIGFHLDEKSDWVTELECGHQQHVRHNPPWTERHWVTTAKGRLAHIGYRLRCYACNPTSLDGTPVLAREGVRQNSM